MDKLTERALEEGKGEMIMADKKRLIDANSLIEDLELLAKHEEGFHQSVILGVVHTVKARRTVDAVEVVRCRNCIGKSTWYNDAKYGCAVCGMSGMYPKSEDGYCSYGLRRTNETD